MTSNSNLISLLTKLSNASWMHELIFVINVTGVVPVSLILNPNRIIRELPVLLGNRVVTGFLINRDENLLSNVWIA